MQLFSSIVDDAGDSLASADGEERGLCEQLWTGVDSGLCGCGQ